MSKYNCTTDEEPLGCPVTECGSDNLEAGRMNTDSQEAWRLVECLDCGYKWDEIYKFAYWEVRKP